VSVVRLEPVPKFRPRAAARPRRRTPHGGLAVRPVRLRTPDARHPRIGPRRIGRRFRNGLLIAAAACMLALAAAPAARADVLLPPAGKVFAGVTGGLSVDAFAQQTGRRPAVFQFFTSFGDNVDWPFARAAAAGARPM